MMLASSTFDAWLETIFYDPQRDPDAMRFPLHYLDWKNDAAVTVACIRRTFENAGEILGSSRDDVVAVGLNYIIGSPIFDLKDGNLPWEVKAPAFDSMFDLFEQCFARRCPPQVRYELDLGELSSVCACWWDALPMHGLVWDRRCSRPDSHLIDAKILEIIHKVLFIDSNCCRDSALGGCYEWYGYYPREVGAIVTDFLTRQPDAHLELREFAADLRRLCAECEIPEPPAGQNGLSH
jgi:hypothetical protein